MGNSSSSGFLASRRVLKSSTAFIIESLLLLVFLIGSLAIVMQLFAASVDTATRSQHLERAVIAASNAAERFSADPAGASAASVEGDLVVTCDVKPEKTASGTLYNASIRVSDGDGEVYALQTSRYVSEVSR